MMHGRYLGNIFAIVGWLSLIGASPPPQTAKQVEQNQTAKESSESRVTVATMNNQSSGPVDTTEQQKLCGQTIYKSNDELCAQWKAADAARDAANWSWLQLILSAFGVIGLGWTLWFNFRALSLSEANAAETKEALEIARDSEKRHLRAYIGVEEVEASGWTDDGAPIVRIGIKNFGQTPAFNVQYAAIVSDISDELEKTLRWDSGSQFLAPTQTWGLPVRIADVDAGDATMPITLVCEIRYTDAFGNTWALCQRFIYNGSSKVWNSDKVGNYENLHQSAPDT